VTAAGYDEQFVEAAFDMPLAESFALEPDLCLVQLSALGLVPAKETQC
jgi:hypothetical protein